MRSISRATTSVPPKGSQRCFFLPAVSLALLSSSLAGAWLVKTGGPIEEHPQGLDGRKGGGGENRSTDWTVADRRLMGLFVSPLSYARFLEGRSQRVQANDPMTYFRNFRRSIGEFEREGWSGDCNDFANSMCEVGYYHGFPMGLVSLWPREWHDRLHKDWHQLAVLCLVENQDYLIFEFERVIRWRGSLDEYAAAMGKSILPVGGILRWRPTKPNPLARFVDHFRTNESLPENTLPLPFVERPMA